MQPLFSFICVSNFHSYKCANCFLLFFSLFCAYLMYYPDFFRLFTEPLYKFKTRSTVVRKTYLKFISWCYLQSCFVKKISSAKIYLNLVVLQNCFGHLRRVLYFLTKWNGLIYSKIKTTKYSKKGSTTNNQLFLNFETLKSNYKCSLIF